MNARWLLLIGLLCSTGCGLIPHKGRKPLVHNPFPQLSKVAVAPFFNLSTEPTVDGRQFALAYFNELQAIPGYEVIPVGVVEGAMQDYNLSLDTPQDAQKLAQLLRVDALVIGAVTDYQPYYPPRCAMQVEWYAADPNMCPIPAGYGLPWGTQDEERIPAAIIFDAKMAVAKMQLKAAFPPPDFGQVEDPSTISNELRTDDSNARTAAPVAPFAEPGRRGPEPVMQLVRNFNGNDLEFTEAIAAYYFFQDDARFGGWQSYLSRSEDFIRFCCHLHVQELLMARGGGGETRVVWRWGLGRY